ncbi:hypothetical protein BSKO_00459 [Bryopsis sp. KO-2023]|nr:hypothetical protein BSKO_00459 [Bryopsis sp. KO-2023]
MGGLQPPVRRSVLTRQLFCRLPTRSSSCGHGQRTQFCAGLRKRRGSLRRGTGSAAASNQDVNLRPIDLPDDIPEASTSSRCDADGEELEVIVDDELMMHLAATAPFAALSLKDIKKTFKDFYDRVYFGSGEFLPIVGTMRMSYGRLIQLLQEKKVKRIYLMADGQVAIVEVPFETHASDYKAEVRYDKNDRAAVYVDQKPEWQMEKMRYYCELPGDIFEDGTFMQLIKRNQYHHTEKDRAKYEWLLREHQVTAELVVLDPNDAFVFLNDQMSQLLPILGLFALRGFVGVGDWVASKFFKKKKDEMAELAEQYARPRSVEFNVGEGSARNDTGIRFEDVAGIDRVKADIVEVIKMMRGDEDYKRMGARPPRGILLEGPPGTGKTYLAKAMAGEGAMPFYSCNGAEFVEMFSGVAAARIRSVFKTARSKAPSIVFIDEIDAIGKRRGTSGDAGSSEREAGLMQLLVEMDGIVEKDRVVVIGATNRISLLDPALLRPGRFDRIVYMGRPSESNRLKILQVHAKNKPIPRNVSSEKYKDDAVLRETARLTLGYSGADLANLLNEAAILSVREANVQEGDAPPVINMSHIRDAMEKARVGLPQEKLPESKAKRFLATVQAGKAVALALTPGMPDLEAVSIRPQGNVIGRILFEPREYGREGDMWHGLSYPEGQVNATDFKRPLGTFEFCCGMLIPLYAGRVTEEVLHGPDSVTLGTAEEIARAGDLAYYLVARSNLHPSFRQMAVKLVMKMGGHEDPTLRSTSEWFEKHCSRLQETAYRRTCRMVEERRPVIEKIADMLCSRDNETILGSEVISLLRETPLAEATTDAGSFDFEAAWIENASEMNGNGNGNGNGSLPRWQRPGVPHGGEGFAAFNSGAGNVGGTWFERPLSLRENVAGYGISVEDAKEAMEVVIGDVDVAELLTRDAASTQINQVRLAVNNAKSLTRLKAVRKFATEVDAEFPPAPEIVDENGKAGWKDPLKVTMPDSTDLADEYEHWGSRKDI